MHYCSECGAAVRQTIPAGDNRPRYVCVSCGTIHYQNPKLVVGCVAERDGRILLCRRAISPRYGFWTLPAGFMENGETAAEGAARETREEAEADVAIIEPLVLADIPEVNQVHIMYRAQLRSAHFGPGPESLDVALVDERAIPWDDIAFPSVRFTLTHYWQDIRAGWPCQFRTTTLPGCIN